MFLPLPQILKPVGAADTDGFTEVLLEKDQGGEYLLEKSCGACAAGTFVFEEASSEAGVFYDADPLSCQACPDDNMSFGVNGQCSCNDGRVLLKYFFCSTVKGLLGGQCRNRNRMKG